MFILKKLKILIPFLFFLPNFASAQFFEIGMGIGGSVYSGDLSPNEGLDNFKLIRPAIGIFASHHFNDRVALKLGVNNFTLTADDKINTKQSAVDRNLSFRSNIWEISLQGEFYIMRFDPERNEMPLSIFVSTGANVFFHNPKAYIAGEYHALQPLSTEGQGLPSFPDRKPYKLTQLSIPAVLGLKYNVGPLLNLFIEFGPRFVFTDYLDDVSNTYAVGDELRDAKGDLAVLLSDRRLSPDGEVKEYPDFSTRGNVKSKDMYFVGLAGVSITLDDVIGNMFGAKVRCPTF